MTSEPKRLRDKKQLTVRSIPVEVVAALVDVPRATISKLAQDCGCDYSAVYRALPLLKRLELVEEAGRLPFGRHVRGPMTYRLHRRVRGRWDLKV